jgi:hypothetical protein
VPVSFFKDKQVQRHAREQNGVKGKKGYLSHFNVILRESGDKGKRRYKVLLCGVEGPALSYKDRVVLNAHSLTVTSG